MKMMRVWTPMPFVCLVAAIWQWAEIADRIRHLARFVSKFGIEPGLITAGSSMVFGFYGATAFFIVLALVAAEQLKGADWWIWSASKLSVRMLLVGALVWGGLLASPLIVIAPR
ncbi:MAG: hypothetical protein JWM59_265 [Verrucomicrobiales bacterium]|nr:hypothetical protein [Verrucomicrobiales bacterium]